MTTDHRELVVPAELQEGQIIAPGEAPPLPAELLATTKAFQRMARPKAPGGRTSRRGRSSNSSAAPSTVSNYLSWRARHAKPDAEPGPVPARGTLDKALAAITAVHRQMKQPFDRKDPEIAETWRGISRAIARKRPVDKAEPLLRDQLLRMLAGLRPTVNAEARDAALLALGWGGALRRSELCGLDWQQLGTGAGYVALTPDG
jgi:integrase